MRLCFFVFLGALVLTACARDAEADLRSRLIRWFDVRTTIYFESHMRCTAAIYKVEAVEPKDSLPVQRDPENAKRAFRMGRVAAIQMAGFSPNDLTDAMLLSGDGIFGKQVLASAAQSVPCLESNMAKDALRTAMTRPGAVLAYDRQSEGLIILDPIAARLFYVAGDVF